LGDPGVDEDNIKMDQNYGARGELNLFGSGKGPVVGSSDHGNELSGYIKSGNFYIN
jgi:hypothetical protein